MSQAGKVPVKLSVTRKGRTFMQTFWVRKNIAGVLNTLASFFGKSKSEAKDIPKTEYSKHGIGEKYGIGYEQWEDSFTEYFKNKAQYDAKYGQPKTIKDTKTGKTYSVKTPGKKKEQQFREPSKDQIMKVLVRLYGKKKQEEQTQEKPETKQEVKPENDPQESLELRKTFYAYKTEYMGKNPRIEEVKGKYSNIEGLHTFTYKDGNSWKILDVNTGLTLESGWKSTQAKTLESLKDRIKSVGIDKIKSALYSKIYTGESTPLNTITVDSDPNYAEYVQEQERKAEEARQAQLEKEKNEQIAKEKSQKEANEVVSKKLYLKQKPSVKSSISISADKTGKLSEQEFIDKYKDEKILSVDMLDELPADWKRKSGIRVEVLNVPKGKTTNEDPTILELTKSHASLENNRYIYNGINHNKDGYVSTDGRRLLFIPDQNIKEENHGKTLPIFRFSNENQVDKMISQNTYKDMSREEIITHETQTPLEGKFPDFEKVIPQYNNSEPKKYNAQDLLLKLENLEATGRLFNKNSDFPDYADKQWGKQPSFQTKDTFTDKNGEQYDLSFNAQYMIDAIKTQMQLGHKDIYIHATGEMKPIVVSSSPDYDKITKKETAFSLIMPMKI